MVTVLLLQSNGIFEGTSDTFQVINLQLFQSSYLVDVDGILEKLLKHRSRISIRRTKMSFDVKSPIFIHLITKFPCPLHAPQGHTTKKLEHSAY